MANKKSGFLRPNIDFSDDEDGDSEPRIVPGRKISNQIKKTQTNLNAIKTPNTVNNEEDDEEDEVVISDDDSPKKASSRKRKSEGGSNGKSRSKKSKRSESDDEFMPEDDNVDSESDNDNESLASEDLSEEENISDSDFNPNSDEEQEEQREEQDYKEYEAEEQTGESTINLSSDDGESPEKKQTNDQNSGEFWSRVDELRSKGISIQQQPQSTNIAKGNYYVFLQFIFYCHCPFFFIFIFNAKYCPLNAKSDRRVCEVYPLVSSSFPGTFSILDTYRA